MAESAPETPPHRVGYTLRQLAYFDAVATEGSIATAARRLHVSPSGVSAALDELERALRTQLAVRRRSHGIELTPAGTAVLTRARRVLAAAEELETFGLGEGQELTGYLRIGCYFTLGPPYLAPLIAAFAREHPAVELDFTIGSQTEINEQLARGSIDLALVYDVSLPFAVHSTRLHELAPSAVLPPEHPLAERAVVPLAELAREPLVLLDVPPSRENTMAMFTDAGLTPLIRFRTSDYEVTRSLVGMGAGCSVLIQHPHGDHTWSGHRVHVRPLEPAPRPVGVCLAWNRSMQLSVRARAMLELARTHLMNPASQGGARGLRGTK